MDTAAWLWNSCSNSLCHKGELKGKVLGAGLRSDQQAETEKDPFSSPAALWIKKKRHFSYADTFPIIPNSTELLGLKHWDFK